MNKNAKENLEVLIYTIHGQRVMLDHDLAKLYGVETKVLKQAVKRNIERFPADFMFQLSDIDVVFLRSQIVTSNVGRGGSRYLPYAFTGYGIAMLSSVLNSDQAIQVHISIIRSFFKMRNLLHDGKNWDSKFSTLEKNTENLFQLVFERLTVIERNTPLFSPKKTENRDIGIVNSLKKDKMMMTFLHN